MREILFRGKRLDTKKWMMGGYYYDENNEEHLMISAGGTFQKICSETVGQYTGLVDKNGIRIFEGDILRYPPKSGWDKENFVAFEVFWHDNDHAQYSIGWQFNRLHFIGSVCGYNMSENFIPKIAKKMEIIGNIHDNPELLEEGK